MVWYLWYDILALAWNGRVVECTMDELLGCRRALKLYKEITGLTLAVFVNITVCMHILSHVEAHPLQQHFASLPVDRAGGHQL